MVEGLLLAAPGGALGLWLAYCGADWLRRGHWDFLPRAGEIAVDGRVAAFSLLVTVLCGVVTALAPLAHLWRAPSFAGGRTTAGPRSRRLRSGLAVAQVAVALTLAIGAGLMARSLSELRSVALGFRADRLLTLEVSLPPERYAGEGRATAFYEEAVAALEAMPGVVGASAASALPVSGGDGRGDLSVEGRAFEPGATPAASYRRVLPGYFRTMGIPVVAGRDFAPEDGGSERQVVVVNESMARRLWPEGDAVGRRIKVGPPENEPWLTVVGVVADVRNEGLGELDSYATYEPHAQRPRATMTVVVRTAGDPEAAVAPVRDLLRRAEPDLVIARTETMDHRIRASLTLRRLGTGLAVGFGAVGVLLAMLGVYGLVAQTVAERRREIGVRLVVGASPANILRGVLIDGARLGVAGLAAGLLGAVALTRLLRRFLFEVGAFDPGTFAVASGLLLLLVLTAALLPARRATRVDPGIVIRSE